MTRFFLLFILSVICLSCSTDEPCTNGDCPCETALPDEVSNLPGEWLLTSLLWNDEPHPDFDASQNTQLNIEYDSEACGAFYYSVNNGIDFLPTIQLSNFEFMDNQFGAFNLAWSNTSVLSRRIVNLTESTLEFRFDVESNCTGDCFDIIPTANLIFTRITE